MKCPCCGYSFEEGGTPPLSEARQAILDDVRRAAAPTSIREIAGRLGRNRLTIKNLVLSMVKDGVLRSPKRGLYIASDEGVVREDAEGEGVVREREDDSSPLGVHLNPALLAELERMYGGG
ncbi:MAG: hypothetical protein BWX67_02071 [Thermotogae bacterium ADurb.Bin062]|nr:MAG: hypothetical protein BWX67_02071 [Thermotogota bacterium ADurb.Bin062]